MERVRVVVFGWLLALGLLFCPSVAYASDGFFGGLEDLTGTREVDGETDYENDYVESYVPELREVDYGPVRALPEDATTVDYVNDTLDSFNQLSWSGFGSSRSLLRSLQIFLGNGTTGSYGIMRDLIVLPAIGVVFLWWGVRKAIRVVMTSWKKGKASL